MKILNPTIHGVLDYALAAAFLLLPGLLGFSPSAEGVSYLIGIAYVVASLVTNYPLGLFKLIPFPVHGLLESIMAAAWIAFPWVLGFAGDPAARNFYVIAGVGLLAVAALTDYKAAETSRAEGAFGERRRRTADRRQRALPVAQERRVTLAERRSRGYAAA